MKSGMELNALQEVRAPPASKRLQDIGIASLEDGMGEFQGTSATTPQKTENVAVKAIAGIVVG